MCEDEDGLIGQNNVTFTASAITLVTFSVFLCVCISVCFCVCVFLYLCMCICDSVFVCVYEDGCVRQRGAIFPACAITLSAIYGRTDQDLITCAAG